MLTTAAPDPSIVGQSSYLSVCLRMEAGALSLQVLCEFYAAATKKLSMSGPEAAAVLSDLANWSIHRPAHADLLQAARLQRRYQIGWWDALIIQSAIDLDCSLLWTEDLNHGQRYGAVTARNPFE